MVHTCMNTHGLGLLPSSSNCTEKTKPQIGGESASGDLLEQTTRDTFTSTQLTAQLPKREIWIIITDQTASATSHNKTQVYFNPLSLTLFPCTGHELYITRDKRIWRVKSKSIASDPLRFKLTSYPWFEGIPVLWPYNALYHVVALVIDRQSPLQYICDKQGAEQV